MMYPPLDFLSTCHSSVIDTLLRDKVQPYIRVYSMLSSLHMPRFHEITISIFSHSLPFQGGHYPVMSWPLCCGMQLE